MGEALKKRILQDRFDDPVVEAILNLMVAADHIRTKVDEICTRFGITHAQYNVLRILRGAGQQGRSRCEIAQRMLDRAPDVTRLVDRLEAQGFAERDRSQKDRRLSITRITPGGLHLLTAIEPELAALHDLFRDRVNARDCAEISRLCEAIYGP